MIVRLLCKVQAGDVLAVHLETIDPSADGNWAFARVDADINVTFASAPDADENLASDSPIEKLGVTEQGFGRYRLRLDR